MRESEYPYWDCLWTSSQHTHTHTSSAHLILEGRRGRACKLKLPLMPLVFQNRRFRGWQIEMSKDSHEVTGGNL